MADWSELPADLLQLISQHLPTSIDILRFRSVCCTWRAAAPPPPPAVFRSPRLSFNTETGTRRLFYLYKSTVYLLQSLLPGRHSSCIIKLGWSNPDKMHLLHPITGYYLKEQQFPKGFPKLFDFSNIRVRELGAEYKLRFINYYKNQLRADQIDNWLLYKEKVAVLNKGRGVFVIMAIHSSGKLMMYKSGDGQWSSIHDDFPNSSWYDDVILWRGKFYALDNIGRIVVVNVEELNASVVAKLIISDNSKKVFVGSDGELLLVDKYLDRAVVKMRVYRLDMGTEIWTEISDLGNQIVFWGRNRAFLVSAGEIFGDDKGRGNFIFYNNVGYDHGELNSRWDGAFDLENGSCMRRTDTRILCSNMFRPPPHWIFDRRMDDLIFKYL